MNSTAPTRISTAVTLAAALLLAASGTAQAQQEVPETGGRVYGLVGGALGDGRFVATGAGAGLRVTRHLGLDVELMHLSGRNGAGAGTPWSGGLSVFSTSATASAADDYPPLGGGGGLFPSIRFEHHERDVTTFLTKFTVEFPIADDLLFPYLTGGGRPRARDGTRQRRHRSDLGDSDPGDFVGRQPDRAGDWPSCSAAGSMYGCGGDSASASTSAGCGSSVATTPSTPPQVAGRASYRF